MSAPHLSRLSRERVRQELEKTMDQVRYPSRSLTLWQRSGAFASLVPELTNVSRASLSAGDHIGLPDATYRPELAAARGRNRLTTLFLDLSAESARVTMEGLRCSNRDTEAMTHHVRQWHAVGELMRASLTTAPDSDLRRWAATIGRTHFNDFMRIATARWMAEGDSFTAGVVAVYRRGTRIAFHDPLAVADLAVDGSDLMELGIPPGPAIGQTLRRLLELVVEDPSRNQRELLIQLARNSR
jgi:tRNA nucleotidyltransferase/poly(A) polymerase